MLKLIINKDKNNSYFISEYNNERLKIIGLILVDPKTRAYFYKILSDITQILDKNIYSIKSSDGNINFKFSISLNGTVIINMHENKSFNDIESDYQTDIKKDILRDLIVQMDEFVDEKINELLLTLEQDNFNLSKI